MSPARWAPAAAAVVLAAAAAGTAWSLASAWAALSDGRAAVARAEAELADDELEAAAAELARAERALARGADRLAGPAAQPARAVPGLARNVAAAERVAAAAAEASAAGAELLEAAGELPGGLAAFAPRDGRLPTEPIARLADPLAQAAETLERAEARVADVPRTGLAGELARARDELAARLATAGDAVGAAAALARELPAFLGADEPRRYLLGAQNPAELRGTGGLIGAVGELTVSDGEVEVGDFRSVGALTRAAPDELPAPSSDFAARYARYSATTHGSNVNMSPHAPDAAAALEALHAAVEGERVDGTILADPVVFAELVELTGPVEVPGVGALAADEVLDFATREQYALLGDEPDRKALLGDVAESALRAFLAEPGEPREALAALGEAAADGRLQIHAADAGEQAAFAAAGVDGGLADPDGDYLAVIGNNAAGHKGDPFYERRLQHRVRLRADGSAQAELTMELTNHAPTEGLHETVLGHRLDAPGDNRTIWSVYCAPSCAVTALRREGEAQPLTVERERDRPVTTVTTELASGESTTLEWRWEVPQAWTPPGEGGGSAAGGAGAGRYRLTIDGQPHLMDATTVVEVQPPRDHELAAAPGSPLATGAGAASGAGGFGPVARFEGEVTGRVELAADVRPSTGRRLADRAVEVLNQPLAELVR